MMLLMRLSSTDIYAFKALAYLGTVFEDARQESEMTDDAHRVSSDQIAGVTGVPKPYLVRLLATLSSKGVISSRKGVSGGYALTRAPVEIRLSEVMRAVDGPIAALSCTSLNWPKTCPESARCHSKGRVWTRVRDAIIATLEDCSVADLVDDARQGVDYTHCLDHLLRPTHLAGHE
jgi:Rrf2 family transcriptional regulator, cysteine metabolism repressor